MANNSERYLSVRLKLPKLIKGENAHVLLHACCAPCSAAIVECMLHNGIRPTVFFCNPNIYPLDEYALRKEELMRFLQDEHIDFIEDTYDHISWQENVKGLEGEPERGNRCTKCFEMRLRRTAQYAAANGFSVFATTLASSRWKDLNQINAAGNSAAAEFPNLAFWNWNWRRGGLQDRRAALLRQKNFYNQLYCGCEFSLRARQEKEEHNNIINC